MEEEINFWKFRHDETSALHERVVEQKWSGKRPYKDYCCTFPFERIEILPRGEVYTCCSGALKSGYHIGNIYTDDFARMWNCEKVKKLRYAVTKGDFEYCLEYCVWLSNRGSWITVTKHALFKKGMEPCFLMRAGRNVRFPNYQNGLR